MKCLIFSDTHGSDYFVRRALAMHPDASVIFFLGDGLYDVDSHAMADRRRTWLAVKGNGDYSAYLCGSPVDAVEQITLLDYKIVITHGHLYGVKGGDDGLLRLADERGADIVLFGHTHLPRESYISDREHPVYLFNPGAASGYSASYGILTLSSKNPPLFSHGYFV